MPIDHLRKGDKGYHRSKRILLDQRGLSHPLRSIDKKCSLHMAPVLFLASPLPITLPRTTVKLCACTRQAPHATTGPTAACSVRSGPRTVSL